VAPSAPRVPQGVGATTPVGEANPEVNFPAIPTGGRPRDETIQVTLTRLGIHRNSFYAPNRRGAQD
jgi:hypothetical protein